MADLSLSGATWQLSTVDPDALAAAIAEGMHPAAARALVRRFGDTPPRSLRPDLSHLHDPHLMLGMDAALDRLRRAVHAGEHVRIVTDYDVDGATSSLILQAALRLAGATGTVDYHIPNRFGEGYGFSEQAARDAASAGVGLIVTADIGVRDHAAVAEARRQGVDVLVCDHHLPAGESVPEGAIVLCPPQQGDTYPNPYLAACGISLKVAQALLADHRAYDRILLSLLKLAAIGTVADLVPLTTRENRTIVAVGLDQLNRGGHHVGLAELLRVSGIKRRITVTDLGFRVGPRINAAGRVADARLVVELLNSRDPEHARSLAEELNRLNQERRDIQRHLVDEALVRLDGQPTPFVVVAGPEDEGWHRGVVGIVAARVKDEVFRPTAVVSVQGELAVGSVRSIPAVHAVEALTSVSDLLVRFGGHPVAAGFTVHTRDLDALRERLSAWVLEHTTPDDLVRRRTYDAEVPAVELDEALARQLEYLQPFGQKNSRPVLRVPGVRSHGFVTRAGGRLLKFLVQRPGGRPLEALWWGGPEHEAALLGHEIEILGELQHSSYDGRLEFNVKDARVGAVAAPPGPPQPPPG